MSEIHLQCGVTVPDTDLQWRAARSGGPGGQHVNTTSSKVELRWSITDSAVLTEPQRQRLRDRLSPRLTNDGTLILHGSQHRSQYRNRQEVMARFRTLVDAALTPTKTRRRTRPSRSARERRLRNKRVRAEIKRSRRDPPPQ